MSVLHQSRKVLLTCLLLVLSLVLSVSPAAGSSSTTAAQGTSNVGAGYELKTDDDGALAVIVQYRAVEMLTRLDVTATCTVIGLGVVIESNVTCSAPGVSETTSNPGPAATNTVSVTIGRNSPITACITGSVTVQSGREQRIVRADACATAGESVRYLTSELAETPSLGSMMVDTLSGSSNECQLPLFGDWVAIWKGRAGSPLLLDSLEFRYGGGVACDDDVLELQAQSFLMYDPAASHQIDDAPSNQCYFCDGIASASAYFCDGPQCSGTYWLEIASTIVVPAGYVVASAPPYCDVSVTRSSVDCTVESEPVHIPRTVPG